MTTIDLTTCETMLGLYIDAEQAILQGQQVRMGERTLTRANLAEVQAGVKLWSDRAQVATQKAAGTRRSVNIAPTF